MRLLHARAATPARGRSTSARAGAPTACAIPEPLLGLDLVEYRRDLLRITAPCSAADGRRRADAHRSRRAADRGGRRALARLDGARGVERLRLAWRSIFQAAVSAGAGVADRHRGARPPAAVLRARSRRSSRSGITVGQRGRRAAEIALGVALGIAVADLLVLRSARARRSWRSSCCSRPRPRSSSAAGRCWPPRPRSRPRWWRRCSRRPTASRSPASSTRWSAAAWRWSINALRAARRTRSDLVRRAAAAAAGGAGGDARGHRGRGRAARRELAVGALERARGDRRARARRFGEAVDVSRETTRYAPPRRRSRGAVESYADAAGADRPRRPQRARARARDDPRALARRERPARDRRRAARPRRGRARARRARSTTRTAPTRSASPPLRAAAGATLVLERTGNLSVSVIVGPDPLDRRRPARRHRDELRRAAGAVRDGRPRRRGRALTELGWEQVRAWRVRATTSPRGRRAGELLAVASRLCGVHAQLMGSAELTLWARRGGARRATPSPRALWEERTLVKTWAMRGTLHLLPAAELGLWHGRASGPTATTSSRAGSAPSASPRRAAGADRRGRRGARRRELTREELADAVAERAGDAALRREARARAGARYLKPAAFRGPALLRARRRPEGALHAPGRLARRARSSARAGDAALREIARRYLAAHGPATREDLAPLVGDHPGRGRQAAAARRRGAPRSTSRATPMWMLARRRRRAAARRAAAGVRLLPAFDQYVIAATKHAERFMPGDVPRPRSTGRRAGSRRSCSSTGVMAGVWRHERKGRRLRRRVEPFGRLTRARRAAARGPRGGGRRAAFSAASPRSPGPALRGTRARQT